MAVQTCFPHDQPMLSYVLRPAPAQQDVAEAAAISRSSTRSCFSPPPGPSRVRAQANAAVVTYHQEQASTASVTLAPEPLCSYSPAPGPCRHTYEASQQVSSAVAPATP